MRDVVFAAYGRGECRAGLEAIDGCQATTPEEVSDLAYWRMCLLSRRGENVEACAEFARRLDEGYWWGEAILADPGMQERLRALEEAGIVLADLGAAGAKAQPDDVIDAAVAAWSARRLVNGTGRSYSDPPAIIPGWEMPVAIWA